MGLLVKRDGEQTKLQEKITAELREKSVRKAKIESEVPDLVEDSVYTKDMKKMTGLMGVWGLVFLAIAVAIVIAFITVV